MGKSSSQHLEYSSSIANGISSIYHGNQHVHSSSSSLWPSSSNSSASSSYLSSSPSSDSWTTHRATSSYSASRASDNNLTGSPLPTKSLSPAIIPPHKIHDLTRGALAALIVIPTLGLLAAISLAVFCIRSRVLKKRREYIAPADMKEKPGSFRRRRDPPPPPPSPPPSGEPYILTSEQNNAYYTGLDTSSFGGSRGNSVTYHRPVSDEPPPPYIREPSPPPAHERARSPFDDPEEDFDIADGFQYVPLGRPYTPGSNRSITSTLYANEASVHEAGEARRSLGMARVVDRASIRSHDETIRVSDPFLSPVSPTAGSVRALSRRMSDVSQFEEEDYR